MRKKLFIAACIVVVFVIGIAAYGILHKQYSYDSAVKNGDVVFTLGKKANMEKLYSFIDNIDNRKPDKIRITYYTVEGDPIIFDAEYDGNSIKCFSDNTRDEYGDKTIQYFEYTKIVKDENNNRYIFVDDTGKYDDRFIN